MTSGGIQSFVVDTDNDMTKDILSRERNMRTRTSVLQSNGKVTTLGETNYFSVTDPNSFCE